jgi:hypothetical protein
MMLKPSAEIYSNSICVYIYISRYCLHLNWDVNYTMTQSAWSMTSYNYQSQKLWSRISKSAFFSVSFSLECCFPLSGFRQCFKIQTISHILLNAQIRPEKTQDRPKNNRQAQKSPPPLMYTIRTNRYKLIKIDTLKEYAEMNSYSYVLTTLQHETDQSKKNY